MITHGKDVILNDKMEKITSNTIVIDVVGNKEYGADIIALYIKSIFENFNDVRLEFRSDNIPVSVNNNELFNKIQKFINKKGINIIINLIEQNVKLGYSIDEVETIIQNGKHKIQNDDILQKGIDELKKFSKALK